MIKGAGQFGENIGPAVAGIAGPILLPLCKYESHCPMLSCSHCWSTLYIMYHVFLHVQYMYNYTMLTMNPII